MDVFATLNEKYSQDNSITVSDYFCEASRFFEKYKDRVEYLEKNQIDKSKVESIIVESLLSEKENQISLVIKSMISESLSKILINQSLQLATSPQVEQEKPKIRTSKLKTKITANDFNSD